VNLRVNRKLLRRIWIAFGCMVLIALAWSYRVSGVGEEWLSSGNGVVVQRGLVVAFTPARVVRRVGLIFYPGGMVDPDAYAPMAHRLAREGFPVRIVPLPFRSAMLESQRASLFHRTEEILESHGDIRWILAGHSRGGALAAQFVHERGPAAAALVLIATTHPRERDLSSLPIPAIKIYGTNDGIAAYAEMRKNAGLLPPGTEWIAINGGNHAQFGYYGFQLGDGRATISREEQQKMLLRALRQTLTGIEKQAPAAPREGHQYTAPPRASTRLSGPPQPALHLGL
jgi:pimeloyl-ACP methyl ester carboxylesterase